MYFIVNIQTLYNYRNKLHDSHIQNSFHIVKQYRGIKLDIGKVRIASGFISSMLNAYTNSPLNLQGN